MAALDYASYMGEEQFAGQPSKKDESSGTMIILSLSGV